MKITRIKKHSTFNIQRPTSKGMGGAIHWMLDVGCWMLNVACFPSRLVCGLLALLAGTAAFGQSNGIPGPQEYPSFSHFITDRNIFNPNRVPHYYNRNSTYRPRPPSRRNGTPGIQFVGTMNYEKGMFAFFGGNSADLSKVLQVGGKIANYTITEITQNSVRLESADKKEQPEMKVGEGFRQENGKWVLASAGEIPAASGDSGNTGSSSSESAGPTPAAPAAMGEPSEALKRLMERRAKENQ